MSFFSKYNVGNCRVTVSQFYYGNVSKNSTSSWTEKRSVNWEHKPFVAKRDILDLGLPPKVWDVDLKLPADFTAVTKQIQMPRSEVISYIF